MGAGARARPCGLPIAKCGAPPPCGPLTAKCGVPPACGAPPRSAGPPWNDGGPARLADPLWAAEAPGNVASLCNPVAASVDRSRTETLNTTARSFPADCRVAPCVIVPAGGDV